MVVYIGSSTKMAEVVEEEEVLVAVAARIEAVLVRIHAGIKVFFR